MCRQFDWKLDCNTEMPSKQREESCQSQWINDQRRERLWMKVYVCVCVRESERSTEKRKARNDLDEIITEQLEWFLLFMNFCYYLLIFTKSLCVFKQISLHTKKMWTKRDTNRIPTAKAATAAATAKAVANVTRPNEPREKATMCLKWNTNKIDKQRFDRRPAKDKVNFSVVVHTLGGPGDHHWSQSHWMLQNNVMPLWDLIAHSSGSLCGCLTEANNYLYARCDAFTTSFIKNTFIPSRPFRRSVFIICIVCWSIDPVTGWLLGYMTFDKLHQHFGGNGSATWRSNRRTISMISDRAQKGNAVVSSEKVKCGLFHRIHLSNDATVCARIHLKITTFRSIQLNVVASSTQNNVRWMVRRSGSEFLNKIANY